MKTKLQRMHPIWLVAALIVLVALSTVTVLGATPRPLQQDATATPAEEPDATTTPAEEPDATTMPAEEPDATTTPAAEAEMTPTPAEEEEATDEATPAATAEPLSDDELISNGEAVYTSYCAACHQLDGQGIENAYPPLAGNAFVTAEDPAGVLRVVFTGRAGMPHFRDYLSQQEIAAAVSYVRNGWENDAAVVTLEEVQMVEEEIYSPSEQMDHNGESEKDGSSAPDKDEQDGDSSED
jgi:cytochrome c oxidase subunit 2